MKWHVLRTIECTMMNNHELLIYWFTQAAAQSTLSLRILSMWGDFIDWKQWNLLWIAEIILFAIDLSLYPLKMFLQILNVHSTSNELFKGNELRNLLYYSLFINWRHRFSDLLVIHFQFNWFIPSLQNYYADPQYQSRKIEFLKVEHVTLRCVAFSMKMKTLKFSVAIHQRKQTRITHWNE